MAIEKFIIEKSDLNALLKGEVLAIQPKGNIKGFCIEIAGNLTNGDVIKAMFPKVKVKTVTLDGKLIGYDVSKLDEGSCAETYFTETFWNAPYKAESEV